MLKKENLINICSDCCHCLCSRQWARWVSTMRRTERYSAVYCVEHFLPDILYVIREGESNYYTLLIFNIPLWEQKRV